MKKFLYDDQKFVEDIQLIRTLCNMNQTKFAELIGVSRGCLNSVEHGRYPLTKTMYLAIMCVVKEQIENGNDRLAKYMAF